MEEKSPSSGFQPPSPVEGEGAKTQTPLAKVLAESCSKASLRKWVKEERKKLNTEELSKFFVQEIKKTEEYKKAQNIMIFYPLKYEINLLELTKDSTKKFYLPKIDGKNLLCCPYGENDELCESCFRTKEPLSEPVEKSKIDLIFIPALAVDKNYYRLGYGGGFYDRFLAEFDGIKIVCISQNLIVDNVFPEEHDIKIDIIITN